MSPGEPRREVNPHDKHVKQDWVEPELSIITLKEAMTSTSGGGNFDGVHYS